MECNDGAVLHDWALAGHGLAWRSMWEVADDLRAGRLVSVLDAWCAPDNAIYAVFAQRRHLALRVRLFIEFLRTIWQRRILAQRFDRLPRRLSARRVKEKRPQAAFGYRQTPETTSGACRPAGHFEHADLRLAEDFFQLGIGIDHALVDRVLQLALLDVLPHLLDHLGTRQRLVPDDRGKRSARGQRFHESRVGFARGFLGSLRGDFLGRRGGFGCGRFGRSCRSLAGAFAAAFLAAGFFAAGAFAGFLAAGFFAPALAVAI
jgi:hypothetical protein